MPVETAPSPRDLTGRRALVTGAASGIGRACAERLAAGGAHVVAADRDADGVAEVARRLHGESHPVDLTDLAAVDALAAAAGDIDILVNNAGFQHVAPIEEFPVETFSAMLDLIVQAPFRLARALLPGMYARGFGRIVTISSVHGLRASPYKVGYTAAKHAVEGLSKVIALEGAPHGVTAVCISPGYVRTPLVERQLADQAAVRGMPVQDVLSDVILAPEAIKELIEPAEVAELVAFACGPHTRHLTGVSLTMDAGWTAQ